MSIRKVVAGLLITAGIAIMAVPFFWRATGEKQTEQLISEFEQTLEDDYDEETDVEEEQTSISKEDEAILKEGGVIGIIEIPGLDIRYPVMEGTTSKVLNAGIGHIEETAGIGESGNCVLCGHNGSRYTICGDDMTKDEWYKQLFERLDNSKFRSSFHLKQKDIDYINEKGLDTIRQHAKDFIAKREAPAYIANDGKQTPMRGHPVFIAQHATATCCRECIRKWHKMQPGKELSQVQQDYLVDVIMTWIQKEMERQEYII